jgi:hypothetical protein
MKIAIIVAAAFVGLAVAQAQTPLLELELNNPAQPGGSYTNTGSMGGTAFNDASGGISVNGSGHTGLATDYGFFYNGGDGLAFGSGGNTATNYPQLDNLTQLTAMMWIKMPSPTDTTNQIVAGNGRLWMLEGACGWGFDTGGGNFPVGTIKFEGNDGSPSKWVTPDNFPFNMTANSGWQFVCWRWDTSGVYKMDVGFNGTLTNFFSHTDAITTTLGNPVWNFRAGAGYYQHGIVGSTLDNVRLYDTNLTDAQVLAIYNADVAVGNVVITTNVASSTAGSAVAISFPTGDYTTNYSVQAVGSLSSPVTWSAVASVSGNNTTNSYYETMGTSNKFFQVQSVH